MEHAESNSGCAARFNPLIAAALAAVDRSACVTYRRTERELDNLSEAIFTATAAGAVVSTEPIVAELGLVGQAEEWARTTIERAAEAGAAKCAVLADVLVLSGHAVRAAAGALEWERWRAAHEDDLSPGGVLISIGEVARHIARRAEVLLGIPMSPAEAAWAAVEGAKRVGLPVDRYAYAEALDYAYRGEEDRFADAEYDARHAEAAA